MTKREFVIAYILARAGAAAGDLHPLRLATSAIQLWDELNKSVLPADPSRIYPDATGSLAWSTSHGRPLTRSSRCSSPRQNWTGLRQCQT